MFQMEKGKGTGAGGKSIILNMIVRVGFIEKVKIKQIFKAAEGATPVNI